jgi:hypothetical protein
VPILWRGCQTGCLAFLESDAAPDLEEDYFAHGVSGGGEANGDGFDIDDVDKLDPASGDGPESASGSDSEDSLDLEIKAAL